MDNNCNSRTWCPLKHFIAIVYTNPIHVPSQVISVIMYENFNSTYNALEDLSNKFLNGGGLIPSFTPSHA